MLMMGIASNAPKSKRKCVALTTGVKVKVIKQLEGCECAAPTAESYSKSLRTMYELQNHKTGMFKFYTDQTARKISEE